jgi:hypothetical protein
MGELVLLVVAAAWAAVLIPPLLRSRIENRPNSSVTDFRRQLNKLQSTVPNRASGSMRGMARPLAQSPLQRPAAAGRPGQAPAQLRRTAGGRAHGGRAIAGAPARDTAPRQRTHGDPTGGQPRPHERAVRQHERMDRQVRHERPERRPVQAPRHATSSADELRRRRTNVLFMLVVAAGATLFLAATTQATAMLYLFAVSFLALCAYAYVLSQARQRETETWPNDWMHR